MDTLGFEWRSRERKSFARRIEDLKSYKEEHGRVNVKEIEDKSLYQFCCTMRHARKTPGKSDMIINEERIASLDALGFDWRMS